jgi:hypothetical protein
LHLPEAPALLGTKGWILFLTALITICMVVPVLNLWMPVDSVLHMSDYAVALVGKIMCYAICALAMDLIWGYTGILSLGHGLFFALGGYVMGICNGFQILTESGLLEGALLHNDTQKFICKNVFLKPVSKSAAPSQDLDPNHAYQIPIAHGEGRFYADDATMASLKANDQILFTYCAADGSQDASTNPNGSLQHIAGITNRNKNVFGMMPHPERAADKNLNNLDGLRIFESILAHCS